LPGLKAGSASGRRFIATLGGRKSIAAETSLKLLV
jgi:hypothetical protein